MAGEIQSISRAIEILKLLAPRNSAVGMRFTDLQVQSGLSKSTLHRILATLISHGLVEQAAGTRLYFLGYGFLELGQRAADRFDVGAISRPALVRLSQVTGDTASLLVRSGLDAVCIEQQIGNFPIHSLTLSLGTRRPLGVGSGSLALLAALADDDLKSVLTRNARRIAMFPAFDSAKLRRLVSDTRERGYAFNDGMILRGMCGVAVPIVIGNKAIAAFSVAATSERMKPERRKEIVALMNQEVAAVSAGMSEGWK